MRKLLRVSLLCALLCAGSVSALRGAAQALAAPDYACLHFADWQARAGILDWRNGTFVRDYRPSAQLRYQAEQPSAVFQLAELSAADLPDLPADSRIHTAPDRSAAVIESNGNGFYGILRTNGAHIIAPNAEHRFIGWSANGERVALIERRQAENYATLLAFDLQSRTYEVIRRRVWIGGQFTSDTYGGRRQRVLVPYRLSPKAVALDLMDADGQNARHLLTDNTFFRWHWSPDGRYVAVLNGVESATRLLIAHTDGSALHELSGLDTFHGLSWQSDGQLAYVGRRAGHWLIGAADPSSGAHHIIAQLPRTVRLKPDLFAVAADGTAVSLSVERRVYVAQRNGTLQLLPRGQANAFLWSPDGMYLARLFVPEGKVTLHLQIVLPSGQEVQRLAVKRSALRAWSTCF
jgi:Tol biopolymer transport system component